MDETLPSLKNDDVVSVSALRGRDVGAADALLRNEKSSERRVRPPDMEEFSM